MSQGKIQGNRIELPTNDQCITHYKLKKLDDISEKIMSGPFWSSLKSESYVNEGIPFIRIKNIENHTINEEDLVYISEADNNKIKNSELNKWDIVLSKIWTIWEFALINFEKCNISENNIWIKLKQDDSIDDKYIFYYLTSSFVKSYLNNHLSWNVQKFLNVKTIKEIDIPLPPIEIQKLIVNKMDSAIAEKKKMELESKEILENINNYVLSELWIKLTGENEEKNYFIVNLEDIKYWRIDTSFCKHIIKSKEIKWKYETVKIKDVAQEIKTWLPIRKDQRISDWNIPYYWANGIIWYMNDFTHDWEYLVVSQDWYIWNHYVVSGKFWASNHNRVMKVKNWINIHYVKAILDITDYEYLITWWVIPKLTKESLETIEIPLPPKEIQDKIANEVKSRIKKANELKKQSNEIYENTKNEVEKMILEE